MKKILFALLFILTLTDAAFAFSNMSDNKIKEAQEYGMMNYQKELPQFGQPWMVYEEKSASLNDSSERTYVYTPYYLVAVNARERLLTSNTINTIDGRMVLDGYHNSLPFCIVLFSATGDNIENSVNVVLIQNGKDIHPYAASIQEVAVYKTKVIKETVLVTEAPIGSAVDGQPENALTEKTDKDNDKVVSEKKGAENFKDKDKDNDKKDTDKKDRDKDKKSKRDKKKEREKAKSEPEPEQKPKPDTVIVEKVVPDIYRVQLFFYFDMRELNTNAASVLSVNVKNENERKFHINLGSLL